MYEELIKTIRHCVATMNCATCPVDSIDEKAKAQQRCVTLMLAQAADAIEQLSKRETPMKITEIHVDEYYCPACGAENNCDQGYVQDAYCPACGQRLLPEPPKEET